MRHYYFASWLFFELYSLLNFSVLSIYNKISRKRIHYFDDFSVWFHDKNADNTNRGHVMIYYLFTYLFICLFTYLFTFLFICLFIHLFIHLLIYLHFSSSFGRTEGSIERQTFCHDRRRERARTACRGTDQLLFI